MTYDEEIERQAMLLAIADSVRWLRLDDDEKASYKIEAERLLESGPVELVRTWYEYIYAGISLC